MKRRWISFSVAAAGVCAIGAYLALPSLVGCHLRSELADRGFPDARLHVASIGLHHLVLRDVHLSEGLDLGTVQLDRGVSLLWRDVDQVAISGANVVVDKVVAPVPTRKRKPDAAMPFKTLHVAGSTIQLGKQTGQVSGTVSADRGAFDVSISVRDPGKHGWSANGAGRVTWGAGVTVAGKVDLAVPRYEAGPFTLTNIHVPATIDARGIRVSNARAKIAGGHVSIDFALPPGVLRAPAKPGLAIDFALPPGVLRAPAKPGPAIDAVAETGKAAELVLRARGIRLGDLLGPTRRMSGTGVIDGEVALRVDGDGVWIKRGEFHARTPGILQITDAALRRRIAAMDGPLSLRSTLGAALTDFRYDTLTAELAPPGRGPELRVATKGRGRTNKQELDISIGVRGVRDASARVTGLRWR